MRRSGLSVFAAVVRPCCLLALLCVGARSPAAGGADAAPAPAADKIGKFPHVEFSVQRRQVRVECESLAVDAPLEFFCCLNGTNEHESVLRTQAKPSDIHTALLAIGLKPGQPLTFLEASRKWLPPQGPPLHISVEYTNKDGQTVSYPAYRWIRELKSKKEPKAFTWVFCGSRIKEGHYVADETGYVISLVNFDFTLIDVPQLASNSNDELEWERNAPLMPPRGTKVWMVIEPAGGAAAPSAPATRPANPPPTGGAFAPPAGVVPSGGVDAAGPAGKADPAATNPRPPARPRRAGSPTSTWTPPASTPWSSTTTRSSAPGPMRSGRRPGRITR